MATRLPGWVVDNAASVAAEAAPYRDRTPDEMVADLRAVCRAGARILALRDDIDAVVAHQDPLPESSVVILMKLREQARQRARDSGS